MHSSPPGNAIWSTAWIIVIVTVYALQSLQIFHYFHRMFVYQGILWEILALLVEAQIELSGRKDVGEGTKTMKQHSSELNDQDEGKEEHKDKTNWFQLEIFLGDVNLFFFFFFLVKEEID